MKPSGWPEELIAQYGAFPIWSVTWHEYYVQHSRHHQIFADAQRLANEHRGQVSLVLPEPDGASAGPTLRA